MAAVEGRGVDVYYDKSGDKLVLGTPGSNETQLSQFAVAANLLEGVTDMGAIDTSVNIIEFPVYGEDIATKIRGLDTPGDLTFDLAFSPEDPDHEEISESVGEAIHIAVSLDDSVKTTTYGMAGIISSASMAAPVDGVSTLSVTVALTQQVLVETVTNA